MYLKNDLSYESFKVRQGFVEVINSLYPYSFTVNRQDLIRFKRLLESNKDITETEQVKLEYVLDNLYHEFLESGIFDNEKGDFLRKYLFELDKVTSPYELYFLNKREGEDYDEWKL